jgi:serine phosphatase RsbU (regulator of sigma subunit)
MPISRSSLVLFNYEEGTFYSYTVNEVGTKSLTNKRVFALKDFGALDELNEKKEQILTNIVNKKVKTETDKILLQEGVASSLMSPLIHGDLLIGSFNVCFNTAIEEEDALKDYIEITSEVAKGLAIAIQQTRLKEEIVVKNRDITASINYAKMIQDAHLPLDLNHNNLLPKHFLFFKPKDIVSGDFYWTEVVGDNLVVVVGDCTGHGVPGAFMTVIGINHIQHIVSQEEETDPGKILIKLNDRIKTSLSSKREIQINDGMDVSVCVINHKAKTVKYAGAKRPLVSLIDDEMIIIPGDKFSIGSDFGGAVYTSKDVKLGKENKFYVFSDGYTDQFGGLEARKFNRKRTFDLIETIHTLAIDKQLEYIANEHEQWKGNREQTDDIVFVGFEISF